jgi:hypothetical protein
MESVLKVLLAALLMFLGAMLLLFLTSALRYSY